ncbi:MAG: Peroxisome chaperone and import receptor [Sclerophora amabilis]|nr:MAG: Peroxisome chaperone and import receptor [Sclerophora amabilis]
MDREEPMASSNAQRPTEETQNASQTSPRVEDIPDPDEDELDDLDDMLDEFSATKIDNEDAPSASGPGRPTGSESTATAAAPHLPASGEEDDFTKQLQTGMADLLGELDSSSDMQQQFEKFMKEFSDAAGPAAESHATPGAPEPAPAPKQRPTSTHSNPADPASTSSTAAATEATFQETIRKTMQRMQDSGAQASAAAASSSDNGGGDDDILAEMLKQMQQQSGGGGDGGLGSEEDFSKMLLGMMEQLTNKDILYDPMKELHDKFPAWLRDHDGDAVPADDLKRYREQQALVGDIVARFEKEGYSDDDAKDREFIVERMQRMQAAGSPPADLVGNMGAAQEALGDLDSGCAQQ